MSILLTTAKRYVSLAPILLYTGTILQILKILVRMKVAVLHFLKCLIFAYLL